MSLEVIVKCDRCGATNNSINYVRDHDIFSKMLYEAPRYLGFYTIHSDCHICYECSILALGPENNSDGK